MMSQQNTPVLSRSIISVPKEWFTEFLSTRGLNKPDKRPLYEYRMTDNEFDRLGNIIKQERNQSECSKLLKILNLEKENNFDTSQATPIIEIDDLKYFNDTYFNALFVLYACACWQRSYDGGDWKWDLIFKSLGFKIPLTKIYPIIQNGFKGLGLSLIENNRTDYLGTIYANSGIPIAFLDNKKDGWLHSILTHSYKDKVKSNKTAKQSVESHKSKITSKTLINSEHTLDLLAKIVEVLDSVQKNTR